jgi:hypothetical protein
MEEGQWNSGAFLAYSCDLMLAMASQMLVNDETTNRARVLLRIFRKISK